MKQTFSRTSYFILFLVFLITYSCQKGPEGIPSPPPVDPLAEKVTASVKGRVTDENGRPVENASVKSGGTTTTTDINGFFRINNVQLAKNAGFVLVEKTGYLKGSRTFFPNAGFVHNVQIQLIPKTVRGNFSAATRSSVVIQSGITVNFPADAIVNANTLAAYTGSVNVIGAYLDPADSKLPLIMPGNLTGLNTNNEQKILRTFGMVAVELEGASGEKLNLATGKTATITMPVPASLAATAPATIPLWFFDETNGLWKEEGVATKQGSNYVGTVSHFSWWNCDVPNDYITLRLTIKNQGGQALSGFRVELRNTQNNSTASAWTDTAGNATGAVPPNVQLEMKVYNTCNNLLNTQNIGPFSANTNLGDVTINIPAAATITISGIVKDCNLVPVTNGYTDLLIDGTYYRTAVTNGSFSMSIDRCSNVATPLDIIATDLQTNQQSTTTTLNVTSGNYSTGDIIACGVSLSQYINFSGGGITINFFPPADSFSTYRQGTTTNIQAYTAVWIDSASYQYTSISFSGIAAPGTYPLNTGTFMVMKGFNLQYNDNAPITITITEFGGFGQYIAGSFSGSMREFYTSAIITGTYNFRVRRWF